MLFIEQSIYFSHSQFYFHSVSEKSNLHENPGINSGERESQKNRPILGAYDIILVFLTSQILKQPTEK